MRTKHLCIFIHIRIKSEAGTVNMFKPSSIFTDSSKAVLLLWILFVIYMLCLTLLYFISVHCNLVITCWERPDCVLCFVTFRYGAPGQVWYLIISIPDLCLHLFYDR